MNVNLLLGIFAIGYGSWSSTRTWFVKIGR
jgi:hypothetical protein